MSKLYTSGKKCQYYTQVIKTLIMSILYPSGQQVKNVSILHKWVKNEKKNVASAFLECSNIEGIFSLNNSRFIEYFDCLPELELKNASNAARSTSYIERKLFNKRDLNFFVVNFSFIRSNIQIAPGDGLYISQLKRCSASWGWPSWI
jgi:hypothetical protein